MHNGFIQNDGSQTSAATQHPSLTSEASAVSDAERALVERAIREIDGRFRDWTPSDGQLGFARAVALYALSLAHAAADAPSGEGWRLIETAPKDGTRILLIGHRGEHPDIGDWGSHGRYLGKTKGYEQCWGTGSGFYGNPTHWMPLPPPPTLKGGSSHARPR